MSDVMKAFHTGCREGKIPCIPAFIILFALVFFACAGIAHGALPGESAVEAKIIWFIKDIYPDKGGSVRVKLNSTPSILKENVRIVNISFVKVPDAGGDGVCAVEVRNSAGHTQTVQVPFKVFAKRELYVLKRAMQKGDLVTHKDLAIRDTYMNGRMAGYPATIEDVIGKALKRDLPANTVLTDQVIEDRVVMKRGEVVTIIAESNKIVVQAKGRAIDNGRMGETIRVKNLSSGKELVGKVVSGTAVKVEF